MQNFSLRYSPIALLLFLISCGQNSSEVSSVPYFNDVSLTPLWVLSDSVNRLISHQVGSFSLTNQNDRVVNDNAMDDKITVVDFFFTRCPGICPKLSKNMARIQDSLAETEDILLLSYSVTPDVDSVPVLKKYADAHGAIDGVWHLLTGEKKMIYDLARTSFFADVDTGDNAFLHTELFYLIDGNRRIRGVYNGTLGTDVVQLVKDIQALRSEAKAS